jgi:hypothetical protein
MARLCVLPLGGDLGSGNLRFQNSFLKANFSNQARAYTSIQHPLIYTLGDLLCLLYSVRHTDAQHHTPSYHQVWFPSFVSYRIVADLPGAKCHPTSHSAL